MRKTAVVLDELRARLGVPARILSAYRNDPYNAAIGGELNSMHTRSSPVPAPQVELLAPG